MPFGSKFIVMVLYGAVGRVIVSRFGVSFLTKELQSGERIWAGHSALANDGHRIGFGHGCCCWWTNSCPSSERILTMSPWWAPFFSFLRHEFHTNSRSPCFFQKGCRVKSSGWGFLEINLKKILKRPIWSLSLSIYIYYVTHYVYDQISPRKIFPTC